MRGRQYVGAHKLNQRSVLVERFSKDLAASAAPASQAAVNTARR